MLASVRPKKELFTMAPPSLRRILPPGTLAVYGAVPIYVCTETVGRRRRRRGEAAEKISSSALSQTPLPEPAVVAAVAAQRLSLDNDASSSTTTTITATEYRQDILSPPNNNNNGIEIAGWKIITSNSSIGDEKRMELLTLLLENTASNYHDSDRGNDTAGKTDCEEDHTKKRRMCLPEITFLDAMVLLHYDQGAGGEQHQQKQQNMENQIIKTGIIRFTARDALLEWAEAHRYLEMQKNDDNPQQCYHDHATAINNNSLLLRMDHRNRRDHHQYRGVSILKTADAKIWSEKKNKNETQCDKDVDTPPIAAANAISDVVPENSQFYYDWTFSSPYAGTIIDTTTINEESNPHESDTTIQINNRQHWQPLTESHIPFNLLQDTTQPILLFDDIYLYEDDLHDNGDASLNIKIRVMPTCWYVLQRLFVRVDYVRVRCREVRCFCLFDAGGNQNIIGTRANTIYRDIVWRDATWDELGRLGLPTDPAAWREGRHPTAAGEGAKQHAPLFARLPPVTLPDDIPQFAYYDARGNNA